MSIRELCRRLESILQSVAGVTDLSSAGWAGLRPVLGFSAGIVYFYNLSVE